MTELDDRPKSTAPLVRAGGCHCGAVRYELRGQPYVAGLCHCTTCRKLTGSPFSATANWLLPQFTVSGEIQTFDHRSFCPKCGSRLFYLGDGAVEIFLGSLDQAPYDIRPTLEGWVIRREHWLPALTDISSYNRNPPPA
jgi:hypothetical protein